MMKKYSIGIDFGTLSGRAVLVDLSNGEELATDTFEYSHGVMNDALPDGSKLKSGYALQHPQDYMDVLSNTIPNILKHGKVDSNDIVGIGIDFTASTVLPVLEDGTPLCFLEEYKNEPHAYVKLWKHHSAQKYADIINIVAEKTHQNWLSLYGGQVSCQYELPKLMEILNDNEEIYYKMYRFVEAADWIVWQLTGVESRSASIAGYKGLWNKKNGYPDTDFFKSLDPRMENVIGTKICNHIQAIGEKAGEICEAASKLTGLKVGTPVAVGGIDAHTTLPAVGVTDADKLLMIMGTSTCHILVNKEEQIVPGICGVVEDGVIPGYFGYEAGQACVGDSFEWLTRQCGLSNEELTHKVREMKPGECGLLALDWWNGNRSPLNDADLTGMILGMTLNTKPEDIYQAFIEATAYGTRMIIENYEKHELQIKEVYASGGIAQKNKHIMQIYADVIGRPIKVSDSQQPSALGSAMFGAVAGGYFENIRSASKVMSSAQSNTYVPIRENVILYQKLYHEYKKLYDYFGKGQNDVMKRLKSIKQEGEYIT